MSTIKNCLIKIITNDEEISDYVECSVLDEIYRLKVGYSMIITLSNIKYYITKFKIILKQLSDSTEQYQTALYKVTKVNSIDNNILYEFDINKHASLHVIINTPYTNRNILLTISDIDILQQLKTDDIHIINNKYIITPQIKKHNKDNEYNILNEHFEVIGTANINYY